jgi:hypothetical protein
MFFIMSFLRRIAAAAAAAAVIAAGAAMTVVFIIQIVVVQVIVVVQIIVSTHRIDGHGIRIRSTWVDARKKRNVMRSRPDTQPNPSSA